MKLWKVAAAAMLLPLFAGGSANAKAVAEDRFAAERCDRLAAFDRAEGRTPVPLSKLDAAGVLAACGEAVAGSGETRFLVHLARGYLKLQDRRAAAVLLAMAVEGGDPAAMFILAQMHHSGHGVRRNLGRAYELYERALEHGYRRAAVGLVILLESNAPALHDPDAAADLRRAHGLEGRELPTLP